MCRQVALSTLWGTSRTFPSFTHLSNVQDITDLVDTTGNKMDDQGDLESRNSHNTFTSSTIPIGLSTLSLQHSMFSASQNNVPSSQASQEYNDSSFGKALPTAFSSVVSSNTDNRFTLVSNLSDTTTLKMHIRTHTGEKSYQCDHCDKTFNKFDSLNVHMRLHTGEKPYSCNLCSYSCRQSSNLIAHKLKHTGLRYACTNCKYTSYQKGHVKSHMWNRHHTLYDGGELVAPK